MPTRPFVDRPVGDVDAAASARRRGWPTDSGLPDPVLLRVGMNALFRAGDVVIRVGRPTRAGRQLAIELAAPLARSRDRGARRPPARTCSSTASWPRRAGSRWPTAVDPIDWRAVGAIVRRVHALAPRRSAERLPGAAADRVPVVGLRGLMADVGGEIDDAARGRARAAIARNAGWRRLDGARVVCHGDVHPGNVMMTADGPGADRLGPDVHGARRLGPRRCCSRSPSGGAATPGVYPAFAAGYGESLADDVGARRVRRAAQRGSDTDARPRRAHRPGRAVEAERRLRYWRGDPDAPSGRRSERLDRTSRRRRHSSLREAASA